MGEYRALTKEIKDPDQFIKEYHEMVEAVKEMFYTFMHHGVLFYHADKVVIFNMAGQMAIHEKVTGFQIVTLFC